ncbi:hypothetical protein [Yeosuana marina]|uniref:hypothetical protein n=1 Tax=Yeosuana marina TaxID=1565536 RepID=UPI0030ED4F47
MRHFDITYYLLKYIYAVVVSLFYHFDNITSIMINKINFNDYEISQFYSCANDTSTVTEKPTINDYEIGEQWTWDWRRSVNGEVRAQGEDYQKVVKFNNSLGIYNGNDTIQIKIILNEKPSKTPRYDWPLKVGKKWTYEQTWENNEGTTGKTSQDVEVVSYDEVTVAAGKFMAYKIEYKGRITNSRGFDGKLEDIWWYAPTIKTYIKHTQDDGEGLYVNELIRYTSPNKN